MPNRFAVTRSGSLVGITVVAIAVIAFPVRSSAEAGVSRDGALSLPRHLWSHAAQGKGLIDHRDRDAHGSARRPGRPPPPSMSRHHARASMTIPAANAPVLPTFPPAPP